MIDASCRGFFPLRTQGPDRPLLWDDTTGRWQTEDALRAQCMAVAARFERPGKALVFLLAHNRPAVLVAFLAAAAAGHTVALIDPGLPADRLDSLCALYRPDIVAGLDEAEWIRRASGHPEDWEIATSPAQGLILASRKARGPGSMIAPDLQVLLLTSGTTGSARFVRLSATAITTNAKQIASSLALDSGSVAIAHLPLHYSYGFSVVTSHLVSGGRIAMLDDTVTSASFWDKVKACGGTHFPGVPFHYSVLARLGFDAVPASVDTFTQAGGHLDTRLQKAILGHTAARGARVFIMYGQTEAAPRMTTLPHARWQEKLGSVGIALPQGKLTIVDGDGRSVPAGTVGALVYEGPNVMMGYAEGRDDLAAGDLLGGRLETGDLGWLDRDGYLFLSGRAARFAKIAGLRLSLDDIEKEIAPLGPAACIDRGERIVVGFEGAIPDGAKARLKSIALACGIPAASFAVRAVPDMPRKPSGKIDYARLKEMADV
jgi:acyl-CoA synthetase (AMP-forming)/AMP-acid ligase II